MKNALLSVVIAALLEDEGRYDNNPLDLGGETYCGISRVDWPDWDGWPAVDAATDKDSDGLFRRLYPSIEKFWREYYSDSPVYAIPFAGTQYQFMALSATSPSGAVWALQYACNALNPNVIPVDGRWGPQTAAAADWLEHTDKAELRTNYLLGAILYYIHQAQTNPQELVFLRGWVLRAIRAHLKACELDG